MPDRVALVDGQPAAADRRRWSYAELLAIAEDVAGALLARFEPGERVAVWEVNRPEWVMLQLGAALAGVILATVNPQYRPAELRYALEQSAVAGLVHGTSHRGVSMVDVVHQLRPTSPRCGILEKDGRLRIIDRKNGLIISGGENVYAAEVERVLISHPRVRDVTVVGKPDPRWGEIVVAVVVPGPGTAPGPAEVAAVCRVRLAGYKCPREVQVLGGPAAQLNGQDPALHHPRPRRRPTRLGPRHGW